MANRTYFLKAKSIHNKFKLKQINSNYLGANTLIRIDTIYLVNIASTQQINLATLASLLDANLLELQIDKHQIVIAPRVGSISPWSSKATDILLNCGLQVNRIEQCQYLVFKHNISTDEINRAKIYDRMIEYVYANTNDLLQLFSVHPPSPDKELSIVQNPHNLDTIDKTLGLALSDAEKAYLLHSYDQINKEPTVTELMMFAQANSEHCRHKIFNAQWTIDGEQQEKSLFCMIRNTEASTSKPAISAYKDNSAVFAGGVTTRWLVADDKQYIEVTNIADILIKVETHNHPTAISPFPGAATGNGGEIRDEAATGQGARPKAGLTGFSVSHLKIPNFTQIWEQDTIGKPARISSALEIMLAAPLGGAAFNNEFGRPNICGYFRSMEIKTVDYGWRGYHKPIMLAGGLGTINHDLAIKQDTQVDDCLVVLGGPAMLIGLGGGAASSMTSGRSCEDLDFASVQRGNPEMERRCQEVIDSCWQKQQDSPIRSIHDVGAGGLSNAMPELLDDAGLGGILELRNLQIDSSAMTPMEIWCNESQERYVLSIKPEKLAEFQQICKRERCPYAVLGIATLKPQLTVTDKHFKDKPVEIPMSLLFGNTPKTFKHIQTQTPHLKKFDTTKITIANAVTQLLNFPTIASKKYLITIGDRTVSGLIHRDQMVGPWQVPVADCGVTIRDYDSYAGEVMAIGEKAPLALLHGAASARMAIGEALTNCVANNIGELANLKISANWMAASGHGREDATLFAAVKAIGEQLCPQLDIGIPVGKDSLSMHSSWDEDGITQQVTAPMSVLISIFANLKDIRKSITPYFDNNCEHNLYLIDLAAGKKRLGGSSLAQVYSQLGDDAPDLDSVVSIKQFWQIMQQAIAQEIIAAYHDISDGGIFTTLLEMCIASQCGAAISLDYSKLATINIMFSEELGAVVAIEKNTCDKFEHLIKQYTLSANIHKLGVTQSDKALSFTHNKQTVYTGNVTELHKQWSHTSYQMTMLRDNPSTCQQEFALISANDKGLLPKINFQYDNSIIAAYINTTKPKIAILREQGVNGQKEMAMAFHRAGFASYDVHMQDLISGNINLTEFQGLAACGGFSYGDVLGAGKGWANSILFHPEIKAQFTEFFANEAKFALGVCNGCQMLSHLKNIIPGSHNWPEFLNNTSQQFEARFSSVKIIQSNSIFFAGMQGAEIPIAIAHGQGRASFDAKQSLNIAACYIDNDGHATQDYPLNPNGSQLALAAVANAKGNVMIMMPHPERVFRTVQMSWYPKQWHHKSAQPLSDNSPWMRMFYNARKFLT
ncbi:MAG: phosphoribosylformylglycinamidine synthase [Proteobacteria bacterium]|nr:phosphoribosylformylglycinamidine synthase [Pseudomonadota bacterium]